MSTILESRKKIDYSSKANPEQLDAIMTTEGPVLIIAGAGTGKTTTLVNRLTHLIEMGTEPSRILLLTFTNKAADEMTERANKLLQDNYGVSIKNNKENDDGLQSGTYHSFCCKLIRRYHKYLGFKKSFTLLDPDDCGQAIEIVMEKEGFSNEDKKYPKGSQLATVFSTAVNKSKSVRETIETEYQDFSPFTTEIEAIYKGYVQYKKDKNILDFDDLLLYAVKLLNENPEVQEEVINRYKYIMVDEYQDSNLVQLALLKALTDEEHMNVCVVGDPDQCFPEGTLITTDDGDIPIENIQIGDSVRVASGRGNTVPYGYVEDINKKEYTGKLIKITTESGKTIKATPEHVIFADTTIEDSYFVYLMYREGYGYRIGQSRTYNQYKLENGPRRRMTQEKADKVWLLGVYDNQKDATYFEQLYGFKYGIPLYVFETSYQDILLSQEDVKNLFNSIDTRERAKKLMDDFGLFEWCPHHVREMQIDGSGELKRLNLVMFGSGRVGKTIKYLGNKHELSYNTVNDDFDAVAIKYIQNRGSYKTNTKGLSYHNGRKITNDIDELHELAISIQKEMPDVRISRKAVLTDDNKRYEFVPFANILPGMKVTVITEDDKIIEDKVIKVEKEDYSGYVYDLNISYYRNYMANNICVHNCIYSFRGSNYSNIINFPEQFEGCKTIILDRNYRSNTEILDLSNQITDKITNRFKKGLRGLRTKGEKPLLVFCESSEDEAKYIFSEIMNSHKRGTALKDMAVLVKGSHDSYTLEALIQQYKDKYNISYQKFGGKKFMDKAFVKDALALAKIIVNPEDSISWFRILKMMPYIGPAHANKITENIEAYGRDFLVSTKNKGKKFATYLPTLHEMLLEIDERDASEKMDYIVNVMYEKLQRLQISSRREGTKKTQYESLKELERNINDLQILVKISSSYNSLEAFLVDLSLDNSKDNSDKDLLTISTVHSAKGLEFKDVYVMQAVDGVYPYESSETVEELDEERRVLYVALTRAKDNLHVMVPSTILKFGNIIDARISPFLAEEVDYMKAIDISVR